MNNSSGSFNPELFYQLAHRLVDDEGYEESSRVRTAVGRAYYAVFLVARNRFESLGLRFHRKIVHQEVHEKVKAINPKLAQKLSTLREARNDADYEPEAMFTIHAARSYIEISRIILEPLSELTL